MAEATGRWLLLIHQLPPAPAYLRVKVGRRLSRLGAVALKNSVYVLPRTDGTIEDFQWLRREVVESGGEATIVDAKLVDGLSDAQAEALFRKVRDADYEAVAARARSLIKHSRGKSNDEKREALEAELVRLERRMSEIVSIDFFEADGRERATSAIRELRARLGSGDLQLRNGVEARQSYRARVWVTRAGIHVDRIASAWLIRRFIDPQARFKFVPSNAYVPEANELRFDMFEAEFSHEGELCTFEALCQRMDLREPGLRALSEVIHDIDLKDAKFARPETDGVAAQLAGITCLHGDDETRLSQGGALCDQLLAYYAHDGRAQTKQAPTTMKRARK